MSTLKDAPHIDILDLSISHFYWKRNFANEQDRDRDSYQCI